MVKKVVRSTVGLALATAVAAGVLMAPAAAQARPTEGKAAKATVTIKVWDVQYFPKQSGSAGALGRAMQQIDKAFMKKYPNIKVNHVGVPGAQFITSDADVRRLAQGPGRRHRTAAAPFRRAPGSPRPCARCTTSSRKQQKNELSPYLEDEAIGDEPHYAMPVQAHVYLFYYNKAMFAKAGIAGPPETFQDLLAACAALKNVGITPITNGLSGTGGNDTVELRHREPGAEQGRPCRPWASRKIGWNDPRFATGLGYLQQLAAAGCFGDRATAATTADTEGVSAFQGGRGAMLFWNVLASNTFGAPVGGISNVGTFAFPRMPTSAYPVGTPDSGLQRQLVADELQQELPRGLELHLLHPEQGSAGDHVARRPHAPGQPLRQGQGLERGGERHPPPRRQQVRPHRASARRCPPRRRHCRSACSPALISGPALAADMVPQMQAERDRLAAAPDLEDPAEAAPVHVGR